MGLWCSFLKTNIVMYLYYYLYILIWNVRFLLVLQNKRVYELIYNRIGNDMLLWVPAYFTVKAGFVRLSFTSYYGRGKYHVIQYFSPIPLYTLEINFLPQLTQIFLSL